MNEKSNKKKVSELGLMAVIIIRTGHLTIFAQTIFALIHSFDLFSILLITNLLRAKF